MSVNRNRDIELEKLKRAIEDVRGYSDRVLQTGGLEQADRVQELVAYLEELQVFREAERSQSCSVAILLGMAAVELFAGLVLALTAI